MILLQNMIDKTSPSQGGTERPKLYHKNQEKIVKCHENP